jgi:lysyl-tRNA synthetase class 2
MVRSMDYDEGSCRVLALELPPTTGEGAGVDHVMRRVVMRLTGQLSIRDITLFPLMRPE